MRQLPQIQPSIKSGQSLTTKRLAKGVRQNDSCQSLLNAHSHESQIQVHKSQEIQSRLKTLRVAAHERNAVTEISPNGCIELQLRLEKSKSFVEKYEYTAKYFSQKMYLNGVLVLQICGAMWFRPYVIWMFNSSKFREEKEGVWIWFAASVFVQRQRVGNSTACDFFSSWREGRVL